jgi:hypothetical protein
MTPKVTISIDKSAISKQIAAGLKDAATRLEIEFDKSTAAIAEPIKRSTTVTNDGLGYLFEWESSGQLTAEQIHEGAVLKDGTRIKPNRWTETAQDSVDLAEEFRKGF